MVSQLRSSTSRRSKATSRYFAATRAALTPAADAPVSNLEADARYRNPGKLSVVAEDDPHPDLLHATAARSLNEKALGRALEFAFISGDAAGAAAEALSRAVIAPSDFDSTAFARSLFIEDLVRRQLRFMVDDAPARVDHRHLTRLLSHPPRDIRDAESRQEIHAELAANDHLLQATEAVYGHISKLVQLFEESRGHSRFDMPRFRLDVLQQIRSTVVAMNQPFRNSTSNLRRMHLFSRDTQSKKPFKDLCSLLNFEGEVAHVDLQLCVGADGRVRKLAIVSTDEQRTARFYQSPPRRFLNRILMWARGYQLGGTELVDRYFDEVYAGVAHTLPVLLQLRGDLEFYLTANNFRSLCQEEGLPICLPELHASHTPANRKLTGLFNPLLLGAGKPPVPCRLAVEKDEHICVITGPNSGGKTRLLQALGLCQLLGQSGFYVPAAEAELRCVPGLFVSLGEETRADQTEGRLGTELLRIRALFEQAKPGSLIILDELCSGTNPSEGEDIFRLVIELLQHLEPEVFVTTHFLKFAAELAASPNLSGLRFLQVELDAAENATYQFVNGVATTSLARRTAERLGVSRDELIRLLRSNGATVGSPDE